MCMSSVLIGGEHQREILLAALELGMISGGYVFIPYDALLYAMPHQVSDRLHTCLILSDEEAVTPVE